MEPKETPSCLISHLVVVLTRKLEILVTTLGERQLFLVTVYMERGKSYLQGPWNILEGSLHSVYTQRVVLLSLALRSS